ncbi:hypothetical protein GP486_005211 [Trichoglossum hirsutum]|uniref:Peptidase C14 caspase domain-containing protein n=1 Tax=Trichoglossum hirsutum TaxID=265104 RepID=A0A9P8L9N6_9PEZI|nr:hypothetical protein GP486_005211 [Trichoglossum hirsutum]
MAPSEPAGATNSVARAGMNGATKAKPMVQSVVQYQDNEELENSRLQRLWNENMEPAYKTPSGYQKTSVILISWDEKLDDLKTKDEVNRLEAVFRNIYNYRTTSKLINEDRKAQVQVNKYLSEWVYNEDGENTLLIVYYAGHGVPGQDPGQLKLAPRRTPDQDPTELNEVVWNHAESNLGDTKADVLVIFDCCYAGDLGRTWRPNLRSRSFEFIGATSAGATTKVPGKSSFTAALMWALEKLVEDQETFTTSELVKKTRTAPNFPKAQVPVLTERNAASYFRIQLSKMPAEADSESSPQSVRIFCSDDVQPLEPQYLELRFAFDNKPRDREIISIAGALHSLIQNHELSARRIDWGGLRRSDMIKIAASKFLESGRRRARRATGLSLNVASTLSSPGVDDGRSDGSLSPAMLQRESMARGGADVSHEPLARGLGHSNNGLKVPAGTYIWESWPDEVMIAFASLLIGIGIVLGMWIR